MELITPVAKSTTEARRFLGAITDVAGRSISKDETSLALVHASSYQGPRNPSCSTGK